MKSINPEQLKQLMDTSEIILLDVRSPAEYQAFHIPGTKSLPLDKLNPQEVLKNWPDQDLYLVCQSGNRSSKACDLLLPTGSERIINVLGGTRAWEIAGYPLVKGKQIMSLERQVRIAAGILVVLGIFFSYAISQVFVLISAFVGIGLIFAGITDTCGMGMLLTRMPWNQATSSSSSCCSVK